MDARLLPELGHHGVEAHAVGLAHAIAAAFADFFIDDEAQRGLFGLAAGAIAALFGGALLIVNDDSYAGDFFQRPQDSGQIVAVRAVRRSPARCTPVRYTFPDRR